MKTPNAIGSIGSIGSIELGIGTLFGSPGARGETLVWKRKSHPYVAFHKHGVILNYNTTRESLH
jgi:hypothetical protein